MLKAPPQLHSDVSVVLKNYLNGNLSWFKENEIEVKEKSEYVNFHYSRFRHPNNYNGITRGMTIKKPSGNQIPENLSDLIVTFPLIAFYNYDSVQNHLADYSNCEIIEKLDGAFVAVSFPDNDLSKPFWQVKKLISGHQADRDMPIISFHGEKFYMLETIKEHIDKINFHSDCIGKTICFELIHPLTRVVTIYDNDKNGLHLIAVRDNKTFDEMSEDELDEFAKTIQVNRPKRWVLEEINFEKIQELLSKRCQSSKDNFEGFILRNKTTGARIKFKDKEYCRIWKMIDNLSSKNLFKKVVSNNTEVILKHFPHSKQRIDDLSQKYNEFIDYTTEIVQFWRSKNLPKKQLIIDYSFKNKINNSRDKFIQSQVYTLSNGQNDIRNSVKDALDRIVLGYNKEGDKGDPVKVLEILGLSHD